MKASNLEQYLNNLNKEVDNDFIFHNFISSNSQDRKEFDQCRSSQQSLCGANVPDQSISFQCFDCAPDPHHMYCKDCFLPELHQNHRAFFRKEATGCCDCGDPSAISNKNSFCKLHREQKIDRQQEFSKVQATLREATLKFLQQSFLIYFKKCQNAVDLLQTVPNPILIKCYHASDILNYKKVQKLLNNRLNLKNVYNSILETNHVYDILISFLFWLSKDRACFALIVAGFLKSLYSGGVTYFEQIILYQELNILFDYEGNNKLDELLYVLNLDDSFRLFTQDIFFSIQKNLWKFYEIQSFDGAIILDEYIQAFENFTRKGIFYTKEKIQLKLFEDYFMKVETCQEKYQAYTIRVARFFSMQAQFVSEEFQDIQFNSPKMQLLLEMNTKIQNILNQSQLNDIDHYYKLIEFFILRFQYNYFIKSFNNTLQKLFNNYDSQLLSVEDIQSLNPNQFFLTALFKSYSYVKGYSCTDKLYQPIITETSLQLNLLYIESKQISAIKQCLTKYLASPQITSMAKQNFINIMFYWCYNFIKTNKNNQSQYNYLQKLYENNLCKNGEPDIKKTIIRLNYCISRSGSLIDKFFIILLTYLFYQNGFQQSDQFKMFLLQTLKENEEDLQQNLSNIYERCMHNFLSLIYTPINDQVSNSYLSIGKEQLEAYDVALIKFYYILYKEQAIKQMINILQSRKYFSEYSQKQYIISIISRILASDKCFSCVCQGLYSSNNLPEGLSFTLFSILSNLFALNHYQEFSEIKQQFEQGTFCVTNFDQYILNFCELDENINKLKLKSHEQLQEYFQTQSLYQNNDSNSIYFDPLLFVNHQSIAQQIAEHLSSQKHTEYFIKFGNCTEKLLQYNQLKGINLELIEFFTQKQNLDLIIQQIDPSASSANEIKLIERLISVSAYLKNGMTEYICESLKSVQMSKDQDKKSIQLILNKFGNSVGSSEQQVDLQTSKSIQAVKMNKMKAKFQQKIQSFQQQDFVVKDDQSNQKQSNDTCALCRLDLNQNQNCCIPILIQPNPFLKYFPIYPLELRNELMTDKLNLLKISITSCKHKFHDHCLIATYTSSQKLKTLPLWFQLQCPVCKQCSETRLPINEKNFIQLDEFNNWLLLQCQNFGMKKYLNDKYGESIEQKLQEIYLSLLVDLLIQLFTDTQEFIRQDKYFVFQNILDCLYQVTKKTTISQFEFQDQQSIFLKLINLIMELLMIQNSKEKILIQFLQENENLIKSRIIQFNYPQSIQNQLFKCFGLDILQQENQINQLNQYVEQFNRSTMVSIIKNQIIENLGFKFKQFYDLFFNKPCSFCNGFSNAPKSSDQFICLLCYQKVCDVECKKLFSKSGNMNVHAQLNHQGKAIYVSLKTGQIALQSSPLTFFGFKNLYQNKFGKIIKLTNIDTQWDEYFLNNKVLNDIADIIISNSLKQMLKNQELNYNQLDVRAYF